jgi:hypothetical protein
MLADDADQVGVRYLPVSTHSFGISICISERVRPELIAMPGSETLHDLLRGSGPPNSNEEADQRTLGHTADFSTVPAQADARSW